MKIYRIETGVYNTSSYSVREYKRRKWWEKRIASLISHGWTVAEAIRQGGFNSGGIHYKLSIWNFN